MPPSSSAPARPRRAAISVTSLAVLALAAAEARAQGEGAAPACFLTGGGTLEICRSGGEAEGVFFTPRPCEFAANVQILRLTGVKGAPGPLQAVYQGETPLERGRRRRAGAETCEPRRSSNPLDGGSVRSGRSPEQLATTMPPTGYRLWEMAREVARPERRKRRGRSRERERAEAPAEAATEGIGARDPVVVTGRNWAGDEYYYVFLLATAMTEGGARRVQIQARTYDFERFDVRGRGEDGNPAWVPFQPEEGPGRRSRRGRGRERGPDADNPSPAAVLDEAGKPIFGNCPGRGFDTQGLAGSISVVDQVYHWFYTDVLPSDCNEPVLKRRTALYLRTSRDLTADRVWSAPRTVAEPLPAASLVRVAKAKGMDRWVVAYACNRPANAQGGPVADLCVQYTPDLSIGSLAGLTWYAEPVAAMRSAAYLGLRSGGDGSGRYGRAQHFWMTDRYGNLDVPTSFSVKAGFLTWLDRFAPREDGSEASSVYGRPVYWATWSVRNVGVR